MRKLVFIISSMLLFASLSFAQSEAEIREELQQIGDEWSKAMVSGDYVSTLGYYAEDAISLPSYSPMIKGIDAIKKSGEEMKNSGMKVNSFNTEITDVIVTDDQIVEVGTYNITMTVPGAQDAWDDHGKYMNVWERSEDGSLKLKVETWNTDTNPWMQMQQMNQNDEGKPMKEKEMNEEK